MTRSTATGAVGALLLLAAPFRADAAPIASASRVADAAPQIHAAAAIDRDDETTCSRARRRLWIEGEGWVVQRITTCR